MNQVSAFIQNSKLHNLQKHNTDIIPSHDEVRGNRNDWATGWTAEVSDPVRSETCFYSPNHPARIWGSTKPIIQ
jgi:hypothetical protein